MTSNQFVNQLFDKLDSWRHFPTYQLERRADIFFALYLPQVLKEVYDFNADKILPEFPVRYGDVHPEKDDWNKSYRIDYVVVDRKQKKVLLIELKTDNNSLRKTQDQYLETAKFLNVPGLTRGFNRIMKASRSFKKYKIYLNELVELDWFFRVKQGLKVTDEKYQIEIIYIAPDKSKTGEKKCISFRMIAEILQKNEDEVSKRFAQSLLEWQNNPS
jgi:hypothetical protein